MAEAINNSSVRINEFTALFQFNDIGARSTGGLEFVDFRFWPATSYFRPELKSKAVESNLDCGLNQSKIQQ